jgi:hypothetical protein
VYLSKGMLFGIGFLCSTYLPSRCSLHLLQRNLFPTSSICSLHLHNNRFPVGIPPYKNIICGKINFKSIPPPGCKIDFTYYFLFYFVFTFISLLTSLLLFTFPLTPSLQVFPLLLSFSPFLSSFSSYF